MASRCSKRTARKPREKYILYCDLSSFGPPLFEIWWPDIYLGGPYGPVKDQMYWPGGLKSAAGQCLCRGLFQIPVYNPVPVLFPVGHSPAIQTIRVGGPGIQTIRVGTPGTQTIRVGMPGSQTIRIGAPGTQTIRVGTPGTQTIRVGTPGTTILRGVQSIGGQGPRQVVTVQKSGQSTSQPQIVTLVKTTQGVAVSSVSH